MVKTEPALNSSSNNEGQKNKAHKTLREKLRKKRMELKRHKKEKGEKKKEYNGELKKKEFFEKSKNKKREDGIKEHRLVRHLETFVDIYQDGVEDFYDVFKTLDEGGAIDIGQVCDPRVQKCLKSIFKHLPLRHKQMEYRRRDKASPEVRLEPLMRDLLSRVIEDYLHNGTDDEKHQAGPCLSSSQELRPPKQQQPRLLQAAPQPQDGPKERQQSQLREYEDLKLYGKQQEKQVESSLPMGPSIPVEQRELLAQIFDQQLKQAKPEQFQQIEQQRREEADNEEFSRIFSMGSGRKKRGGEAQKSSIEDVPAHLLAQGSARIGEKQEVDAAEMEEYNRTYRPKKLVEEHQEMLKMGKFGGSGEERKPFDRERDIVNGRSRQHMNNGVFFDFKDRMTKPKSQSHFL